MLQDNTLKPEKSVGVDVHDLIVFEEASLGMPR